MHRERVPACVHPETYKYFLDRDAVLPTWARLAARYGEPRRDPEGFAEPIDLAVGPTGEVCFFVSAPMHLAAARCSGSSLTTCSRGATAGRSGSSTRR